MIQATCWTLVHSLWQGLLFAMITGVVMVLTKRASAAVRYNILCVLFFLFLGVCAATFLYEWTLAERETIKDAHFAVTGAGGVVAGWIGALGRYCSDHAVPIVWGWLFIVAIKFLRMLGGFLYSQRVRHYGIRTAPEGWQERINDLCQQMGIRRAVKLVESQIVKMPLVIGHWRPMIFIPLGLITGLPKEEIEAVLLHELAHIRRHDYIVNFLQTVAVNLLFFNPGVLWISSLLKEERENCCDDIAIARTSDRTAFLRALISFKEHNLRMSGLALAFPAGKNQLMRRAMRIALNADKTLDPIEKIFLMVSFVLVTLLVVASTAHAPVTPPNIAQIPGGNYRVFIDTPMVPVVRAMPPVSSTAMPVSNSSASVSNSVVPVNHTEDPVSHAAPPVKNVVISARESADAEVFARDAAMLEEKERQDELSKQALSEAKLQGDHDRVQAELDAKQAFRDKEQAKRDQEQAERDAKQAVLDKVQAERDAEQAVRNKEQAERDAKQAIKDKEQADRERAQDDKRRAEAESGKKHISP